MQGVAFLARPVLEVRVIDPAVLEEAVLDVLVDRHDRLDVFEVVQALAVGDLVQGPDRNEIDVDCRHDASPTWKSATRLAQGIRPRRNA